ncbi:hypothetical protein ACOSP6_01525 [Tenacibaculum sp. MEBiC06402]|uniref:hypothetical protein n=1 Tax=unclassified Tenacibaculum TaxID=2635139 RepID=UPI003B9D6196
MLDRKEYRLLSKNELQNIKGKGGQKTWTPELPKPCTGDLDGDPNTTWDRYCKKGETIL